MTRLVVRLDALERNYRAVAGLCARRGVGLVLVAKVLRSHPAVVERLESLGLASLADVSPEALAPYAGRLSTLLLKWSPDDADRPLADLTLVSSLEAAAALGRSALAQGRTAKLVVSVELGDLRDGVPPEELVLFLRRLSETAGVEAAGISGNLGCLSGKLPDPGVFDAFVRARVLAEAFLGRSLEMAALGGTVVWDDLEAGRLPPEVSHLRLGEAVFFGNNLSKRKEIPGLDRNVLTLRSQVVELREKSTCPAGDYGWDSFGRAPDKVSCGSRRRAVLDFGELAASFRHLDCLLPGAVLVGSTHDFSVLELDDESPDLAPGDWVDFRPSYNAAAHAALCPDVRVVIEE